MPKRFSDTKIWDQTWYLQLAPEYKIVWNYLQMNCDHAGVWDIDLPQLNSKTGISKLNLIMFLEEVNRDYDKLTGDVVAVIRVKLICNNSKLWLTGFISEQYEKGTNGVNPSIPALKGVIRRLRELGLYDYSRKEGYLRLSTISPSDNEPVEPLQTPESPSKGFDRVQGNSSSSSFPILNLKEEGLELFRMWGINGNPEELSIAVSMIESFGLPEVKIGFREALQHGRNSLAYAKGVCRKRKEKAVIEQNLLEAARKKKEMNDLIASERKSGVKLNLIEQVYGSAAG